MALTGMAPAVLTETIYALSSEKIIPDRIIAVTTKSGKEVLEKKLTKNKKLLELRKLILGKKPVCKLILHTSVINIPCDESGETKDLEDIWDSRDSEAAAEFLFNQIRSLTSCTSSRLIVSMSGGRKTLGVMVYACMCIFARRKDRVVHVLVNAPFDNPKLEPPFYYPDKKIKKYVLPDSEGGEPREIKASSVRLELADVPILQLRDTLGDKIHETKNFMDHVKNLNKRLIEQSGSPRIEFSSDWKTITVNGEYSVKMTSREYLFYKMLVLRCINKESDFSGRTEAAKLYLDFLQNNLVEVKSSSSDIEKIKEDIGEIKKYLLDVPVDEKEISRIITRRTSDIRKKFDSMPTYIQEKAAPKKGDKVEDVRLQS